MGIPDNYRVLFVQGGGIMQFSMVPLNLLRNSKKADYAITGSWAKKAYKEAAKYGDIKVIASSEEDNFTWVPKFGREQLRPDADYVYITSNNTIYGTRYNYVPDTGDIPLVTDMSLQHSFRAGRGGKIRPDLRRRAEKISARPV